MHQSRTRGSERTRFLVKHDEVPAMTIGPWRARAGAFRKRRCSLVPQRLCL